MKKLRIAIDFDGVLADGKGIPRKHDFKSWKPKKDAVAAVKFLRGLGYDCFILTSRGEQEHDEIKKWLEKHGFSKLEVTNRKKNAIVYIDDRAIRFENNWQSICKLFG